MKHGCGYAIKLMSIMDASLVAESMTLAVESMDLGSAFIGTSLANDKVIKALKLPKGVLPLTLLCIGYANEKPPIRPRWSLSSVLHIDHYQDRNKKEMKTFLRHMSSELQKEGYYQKYGNQGPNYRYSNYIKHKTALKHIEEDDAEILPLVKETGFLPGEAI